MAIAMAMRAPQRVSNTKSSSRIEESEQTVAQSDVLTDRRHMDGDESVSDDANVNQRNATTTNPIEDTAKAVVQSETIPGGDGDGDGDGGGGGDNYEERKSKPGINPAQSDATIKKIVINSNIDNDGDSDNSASDNEEQRKTKPNPIIEDVAQNDTIIKKNDGDALRYCWR
jgi:hypothetical protein